MFHVNIAATLYYIKAFHFELLYLTGHKPCTIFVSLLLKYVFINLFDIVGVTLQQVLLLTLP